MNSALQVSGLAGGGGSQGAGRRNRFRLAGIAVMIVGLVLMLGFAGEVGYGLHHQSSLDRSWHAQLAARPVPATFPTASDPGPGVPALTGPAIDPHPVNGVDFAISVPKLGYSAAVQEGTDSRVLADGPGHYPSTPWPGELGNVGVAAHNIYWIRFNDLQPGDAVVLQTRWGDYTYRVTGKQIVEPDNRQVLAPTSSDRLTLTTCWPLWAGAFATQRLIIFADQVSPTPHNPRLNGLT